MCYSLLRDIKTLKPSSIPHLLFIFPSSTYNSTFPLIYPYFDMSSSPVMLAFNGPLRLSPWELFDRLWTSVTGYPAEDFQFVPGKTPFATLGETVGTIVLYYAVIFGGREWMRNRPAYKLNGLFMAHNFMLTVVSASLLILFAGQLIPTLWNNGLFDGICGGGGWTKPLVTLYFVSYLQESSLKHD
jgi:fatty acid elongase 3